MKYLMIHCTAASRCDSSYKFLPNRELPTQNHIFLKQFSSLSHLDKYLELKIAFSLNYLNLSRSRIPYNTTNYPCVSHLA